MSFDSNFPIDNVQASKVELSPKSEADSTPSSDKLPLDSGLSAPHSKIQTNVKAMQGKSDIPSPLKKAGNLIGQLGLGALKALATLIGGVLFGTAAVVSGALLLASALPLALGTGLGGAVGAALTSMNALIRGQDVRKAAFEGADKGARTGLLATGALLFIPRAATLLLSVPGVALLCFFGTDKATMDKLGRALGKLNGGDFEVTKKTLDEFQKRGNVSKMRDKK